MTRRLRGLCPWIMLLAFSMVVALSSGVAGAADKSRVDRATSRVEPGARQIGEGKVIGIGHTIVEGARFSGATIGEFFKKAFG